jgi:hypothetical protein
VRPTQRVETALQVIDESRGGVEANDRFRGGDEVRQHVDVAKERLTAGGVPDLFHSADVEARGAAQSPRLKGASIDAG